jgi:hypothetical protein
MAGATIAAGAQSLNRAENDYIRKTSATLEKKRCGKSRLKETRWPC